MKKNVKQIEEPISHQSIQVISQAFSHFGELMQKEAKRFTDEQKKVQEKLENGARITKHRINL